MVGNKERVNYLPHSPHPPYRRVCVCVFLDVLGTHELRCTMCAPCSPRLSYPCRMWCLVHVHVPASDLPISYPIDLHWPEPNRISVANWCRCHFAMSNIHTVRSCRFCVHPVWMWTFDFILNAHLKYFNGDDGLELETVTYSGTDRTLLHDGCCIRWRQILNVTTFGCIQMLCRSRYARLQVIQQMICRTRAKTPVDVSRERDGGNGDKTHPNCYRNRYVFVAATMVDSVAYSPIAPYSTNWILVVARLWSSFCKRRERAEISIIIVWTIHWWL